MAEGVETTEMRGQCLFVFDSSQEKNERGDFACISIDCMFLFADWGRICADKNVFKKGMIKRSVQIKNSTL